MGLEVPYFEKFDELKMIELQRVYKEKGKVEEEDMISVESIVKNILKKKKLNGTSTWQEINEAFANSKKNDLIDKYLKNKNIFNLITEEEMDKKIVKEIPTRKALFLCAQGRLVKNAQIASYNILVNDDAGAGKDYVTSKALEMIPEENYVKKTRISPTVFTYWHNSNYEPGWTWDGKVFYTEDINEVVLNSEVFKVMCSSGSQATIVIRQRAVDIDIKGKPVIITTTATAIPSAELTRRFEIINLDESISQTEEIMKRHCDYAMKGITPEYNQDIIDIQKELKRVKVKIPFADKLHILFPAHSIMMRTKFPRFLDLIKASTAFHQFQRKVDEEGYYVAEGQDYDIASEVMRKMMTNKYAVSLTKNQRKIMEHLEAMSDLNKEYCESVTHIREQMNNFISLPAMVTNLSQLTGYGLVKVKIETNDYGKEVEKYYLNESIMGGQGVIFPSFLRLCEQKGEEVKELNPRTT